MVYTTMQELMFLCPDKNVPVSDERIVRHGRLILCAQRHLVLGGDCFLEGEELQA
jgi:hypothetical protein